MTTTLESITPNIMVANINDTLKFYVDQLGFTLIDTNPETGPFEWAYVMRDGVGFMFQTEASLKTEYPVFANQSVGGALTLYIRIKQIKAYFNTIAPTVKLVKPLNTTFYGTEEFAIQDPNGFVLTFSETPE